ncbi:nucleoside-diphosphate sugar epimerase/dehydratase [Elioraea sp.]|uniref:polysaccharide biosynthesis protein n=1 Tax=Elioraea sp. TaxID=2185103 RepID=UPI0025B90ACF|nr:nucleoside-diphosphate sugar epimerase/dehydratase [Elioraea sp.]
MLVPSLRRLLSRRQTTLLADTGLAALAAAAASLPEIAWFGVPPEVLAPRMLGLAALGLGIFAALGVPRDSWRHGGTVEMARAAAAAILAALAGSLIAHLALPNPPRPGTIALLLLLLPSFVIGARGAYRLALLLGVHRDPDAAPIILAGAGDQAELLLRALARQSGARHRVVGVVAVDPNMVGQRLHGAPVLGTLLELGVVLDRLAGTKDAPVAVAVASRAVSGLALTQLRDAAADHGLPLFEVPRPADLRPRQPRRRRDDAPADPQSLLDRPETPIDRAMIAAVARGKRVLVTGAGGSIGSELVRQVAEAGPAHLTLVDNGEFALYAIDMEIAVAQPRLAREAVIMDIRDRERIAALFARSRPELVFHAAALKHVPLVEANPLEAILTNACGTRNVADAAVTVGAEAVVLISTDKAVNPTSVMGATKRLAEMYCQGLDLRTKDAASPTRFVTVRFGNVLGSTGSVVPLFQAQLARGGPLTVTHPDMVRYFMTTKEAVGLVLQAMATMIRGGSVAETVERGAIFVLDMGKQVRILDLAHKMIRLAGLRPDVDVKVQFTGLRPGEKLYEELFHGREELVPLAVPGLLVARPRVVDVQIVARAIDEAGAAARAGRDKPALALLSVMVPEFAAPAGGN